MLITTRYHVHNIFYLHHKGKRTGDKQDKQSSVTPVIASVAAGVLVALCIAGVVYRFVVHPRCQSQAMRTKSSNVPLVSRSQDLATTYCGDAGIASIAGLRDGLGKIIQGLQTRDLLLKEDEVRLGPKLASGASGSIYTGFFAANDVVAEANVALKETFQGMMFGDPTEILHEVAPPHQYCAL